MTAHLPARMEQRMDDSLQAQEQDHVLIIEDDERLAGLTRDCLEANGFQVTVEAYGARGVGRTPSLQPDLVIIDLLLPGEAGLST